MIVRLLWTFYSLLIFFNDNNFLMAPDIQNNFILQKIIPCTIIVSYCNKTGNNFIFKKK